MQTNNTALISILKAAVLLVSNTMELHMISMFTFSFFILDYPAFLQKLKTHFDSSDKKYYVTAAPQCVFPDANLQTTINQFGVDAVFVQFCKSCALPFSLPADHLLILSR